MPRKPAQKYLPESLSFATLFDPALDYAYFAGGKKHAFNPAATCFDLLNASWMADFALLAYLEEADVSRQLESAGLVLEKWLDSSEQAGEFLGGTQGYIARDEAKTFLVVSFRGTQIQEVKDLLADADVWPERAVGSRGSVHRGFRSALSEVWEDVESCLEEHSRSESPPFIWFTGHSLGGALATLASSRYRGKQGVYTFGSPRVGDRVYHDDYVEQHYRFVNQNDIVTLVPPRGPFKHVGQVKYIAEDPATPEIGLIHDDLGRWREMVDRLEGATYTAKSAFHAWLDGRFDGVVLDGLVDHSPVHYATKIWNAYLKIRR
ncbi:MAG: lipase family protein [bacterium]|nr:lipase family protein [bacterium]